MITTCRLIYALCVLAALAAPSLADDTCLLISAENIATGEGNFYAYVVLSREPLAIEPGDQLEYDILLPAENPLAKGGVDFDLTHENLPPAAGRRRQARAAGRRAHRGARVHGGARPWARDAGLRDQSGASFHGDAPLDAAVDRWLHRTFDLTPLAGGLAQRWLAVFEGDRPGRYIQLLDNIRVIRAGRPVLTVYADGPPPEIELRQNEGYSREILVTTTPRTDALASDAVQSLLARARAENELRRDRERFRAELTIFRELAPVLDADGLPAALQQAAAAEDTAAFDAHDAPRYRASLAAGRRHLEPFEPLLARYTGHLVGHAHIDLQWLWNWKETTDQIIPQTFGQAVKFMQEFPDFTFSQSSAALYWATEQHHPELFREIQKYVQEGRWELVGGRWCEGDLNMISPESHVRQFLCGQRYFQQKFGRICSEGWEPDTFGHPWTLPQILRKSGIRSYYFCRAGRKLPLFWWEGPDGSRVLAFDESPLESWYIGSINAGRVERLAKFAAATGVRDYLIVYGVGNHGGGPTRENIEAALAMRDRPGWPTIRFSTVTEFFRRLYDQVDPALAGESAAAQRIPVVRGELNPVFEGCYTSHSRIKRYNRDSESLLEGTEVFAALAALPDGGPPAPYPRAEFERLWRDLLWNHHHDTLCGSFIHSSSEESARMYEELQTRGRGLLAAGQDRLRQRVGLDGPGPHVVVYNPLAWERTEVVEIACEGLPGGTTVLVSDAQGDVPTQWLGEDEHGTSHLCFLARRVPGCGLKVFRIRALEPDESVPMGELADPPMLWPQFELLHEKPRSMSAWELGEVDETIGLADARAKPIESGPVRTRTRTRFTHEQCRIVQDIFSYPGTPRLDCETLIEWGFVGDAQKGSRTLKVVFPVAVQADSATFEIPFGDVSRPADGRECVALKWCDLTGKPVPNPLATTPPPPLRGLTVLNDCKHGYSVREGTIRLTLLRSSYDPDPRPDVGTHRVRYSVLPHDGPLNKAFATRAAWEFNKPLQPVVIPAEPQNSPPGPAKPPEWSGCSVSPANVVVTALKLAEDGDEVILRAYECAGEPAQATFTLGFDARNLTETDLLERPLTATERAELAGRKLTAALRPYEIRTFRLQPAQ